MHFTLHNVAIFLVLVAGALAQLPNGWFGYQNARWSECNAYYTACRPTNSACARGLCSQCLSIGGSVFRSCCAQPAPYLCFQTAAGGGAAITTAPPVTVTDRNALACQTAANKVQSCELAISGFDDLPDSVVASCLCYSNSSWNPTGFDQPWSSCIAWASTADTSVYTDLTDLQGFCSTVGNVAQVTTAATGANTITPGPTPTATASLSNPTDGSSSPTATKSGAGVLKPTVVYYEILVAIIAAFIAFNIC